MNGTTGITNNKMEHLTREQKLTLNFIIKHSRNELDLKWKLKKYIESGDLSFLGAYKKELDMMVKATKQPSASVTND
ncbi:MAG: hypothetical protein SLAVMIC_00248 [uncultured marine phage]|uniref:Uncharacterized protein n=1 Tax=uncultured marine phage TaxID=707152 RepID=A0A8D9C8L1_9VIRU|nr:MAG: hypothetical protein SLAVMIC_00248 [uncultured marine phage]